MGIIWTILRSSPLACMQKPSSACLNKADVHSTLYNTWTLLPITAAKALVTLQCGLKKKTVCLTSEFNGLFILLQIAFTLFIVAIWATWSSLCRCRGIHLGEVVNVLGSGFHQQLEQKCCKYEVMEARRGLDLSVDAELEYEKQSLEVCTKSKN